jgi:hypothetical protein
MNTSHFGNVAWRDRECRASRRVQRSLMTLAALPTGVSPGERFQRTRSNRIFSVGEGFEHIAITSTDPCWQIPRVVPTQGRYRRFNRSRCTKRSQTPSRPVLSDERKVLIIPALTLFRSVARASASVASREAWLIKTSGNRGPGGINVSSAEASLLSESALFPSCLMHAFGRNDQSILARLNWPGKSRNSGECRDQDVLSKSLWPGCLPRSSRRYKPELKPAVSERLASTEPISRPITGAFGGASGHLHNAPTRSVALGHDRGLGAT